MGFLIGLWDSYWDYGVIIGFYLLGLGFSPYRVGVRIQIMGFLIGLWDF